MHLKAHFKQKLHRMDTEGSKVTELFSQITVTASVKVAAFTVALANVLALA